MSVIINGMDMPKGNSTKNVLIYGDGTVFTGHKDDVNYSAEERKKGKWIPHSEKSREYIGTVLVSVRYDYWFCDDCGYRVENGRPMYNFCPNCGADMRGGQDNRDERSNLSIP